jgi:hypothetical protein
MRTVFQPASGRLFLGGFETIQGGFETLGGFETRPYRIL